MGKECFWYIEIVVGEREREGGREKERERWGVADERTMKEMEMKRSSTLITASDRGGDR